MKVIKIDNTYRTYGDDLKTFDKLPAQVYTVCFSKNSGFYLDRHSDIEIKESKIYGVHDEKVDKVIKTFTAFDKNLGIILSGHKGIGKSLFAKELAKEVIKKDIPVILVDTYIPGIASYLEEITQEVMVLFDEYDKTFGGVIAENGMPDPQTELLTLFDGLGTGKKMFVITCNSVGALNDFLVNRPGRFHYHFRFEYPNSEEIIEYMHDKLFPDYYSEIEKVISFSRKVSLNYDCLRAIAFELNTGSSFEESIKDLNIINLDNEIYTATLYLKDGRSSSINMNIDLFDRAGKAEDDRFCIDCIFLQVSFDIINVRFDTEKYINIVSGDDITINPDSTCDKDEIEEVNKMEPAYVTLVKRKEKSLHYTI